MLTFYHYKNCSTCKKAKSHLTSKGYQLKEIDITLNPPSVSFLKKVIKEGGYELKQLFNTSGQLYREMDIKSKIKTTSEKDLLNLLAKNGKLIKRPIITDGKIYTVGFREDAQKKWK